MAPSAIKSLGIAQDCLAHALAENNIDALDAAISAMLDAIRAVRVVNSWPVDTERLSALTALSCSLNATALRVEKLTRAQRKRQIIAQALPTRTITLHLVA